MNITFTDKCKDKIVHAKDGIKFALKGYAFYTDVIDEERRSAEFDRDYNVKGGMDWEFVLNIKCIPILVYKKECVGYIDGNGDKHYYKQIMKEHKKQAKKFFKGVGR